MSGYNIAGHDRKFFEHDGHKARYLKPRVLVAMRGPDWVFASKTRRVVPVFRGFVRHAEVR